MTAMSAARIPKKLGSDAVASGFGAVPVAASIKIWEGALVFLLATGYASDTPTATALCLGVAPETVDNSTGSAGDLNISPKRGTYAMVNSAGGDALAAADIGKRVYAVDDQTVAKTSNIGTRCVAGTLVSVEGGLCYVEVGLDPAEDVTQSDVPQTFAVEDAVNTGVTRPVTVTHTTTGTPGAGIGVGQLFQIEVDDGLEDGGALDFVATDESTGSEDTALVVSLRTAGAAIAEKFRVSSVGDITNSGTIPAGKLVIASQAIGDLLVADSANTMTRLPDVATGQVLKSGGVGAAPVYAAIGGTTAASGTDPTGAGSSHTHVFTGTAPTTAQTDYFVGTGYSTAGQVVTTSDNHTVAENEYAGMWLITATKAPCLIVSHPAASAGTVALTVIGAAPATTAEAYRILRAPTPAGTNAAEAAHTHAGPSHTHSGTGLT